MNNPNFLPMANDSPFYGPPAQSTSYPTSTKIVSTLALLVLGYYVVSFLDAWPSTVKRASFELCIQLVPSPAIYAMQYALTRFGYLSVEDAKFKRIDYGNMTAKKDALKRMFGNPQITGALGRVRSLPGVGGYMPTNREASPPGLGNWDNSCYQNSVLQGLASLPAFLDYVETSLDLCDKYEVLAETHRALMVFLEQLGGSSSQRTVLWTPDILKSMNSWQQQDAQEYFSRVLEAVEREAFKYAKMFRISSKAGLECLWDYKDIRREINQSNPTSDNKSIPEGSPLADITSHRAHYETRSPMDGMTAQGLVCKTCGYTEGLSLTQFNCLTLNMGLRDTAILESLLDDFTAPEEVDGVECEHCTKIASDGKNESDDAEDQGQAQKATTTRKPILRTKAKQITIGRLPRDLVLHINRSIFDEYGTQRKNSSPIKFPTKLDLKTRWCAPMDDAEESIEAVYELKCVVTHYGRHDNGHYVALAQRGKNWYSFNDEIVTKISEEDVLARSNGFIFFYEAVAQ